MSEAGRTQEAFGVKHRIFVAALLGPTTALVLAVLAPSRGVAQATGWAECRTVRSAILHRAVRYCVLLPPGFDADKTRRFPVLYYLHGLGDNEQSLLKSGGWEMIEQLREQGKIGQLIVVVPDGGRSFFVNSRDGKERYEDFFMKEFLPAIEQRYRGLGKRAGRGISGTSMGGYGALRFAFKYPQQFAAVSAHGAALFDDLPETATELFGRNFRAFGDPLDPAYWKQNTPLTLASTARGLGQVKIYFDCGLQDDYGFDAGARQLHEILERRKIPHEFHLYPGGHNWQYVAEHFGESMAFQSQALGAQ
jgi:S-formylglutathione hydrolase FrmB